VSGLSGCHKLDAVVLQGGLLRLGANAPELRKFREEFLSRFPHLPVGLDTEHGIAIPEQHPRENTRSKSNVGDRSLGSESASLAQQV